MPEAFQLPQTAYYFDRFGFCPRQIAAPPHAELGLVVVIPSFDEPGLLGALQSLRDCVPPRCAVEVVTVINSAANADAAIKARNLASLAESVNWASTQSRPQLAFHFIHAPDLPPKRAGVGLARKIGMDEAIRRFDSLRRLDGIIACFDADCTCDTNYLTAIESWFAARPKSPACGIYFEHPLAGPEPPEMYRAITLYELHLRYYVQGLRFANFPHAFHTIGSSMAVRAEACLKQGGMNRRQAGEDFYFLHKLIPLGGFGDVTDTRVVASPRPSTRVPFGTGRGVLNYVESGEQSTYALEGFLELRDFFARIAQHSSPVGTPNVNGVALQAFLETQDSASAWAEILSNTRSPVAFRNRFFRWFDGFRVMKFLHFARDHFYAAQPVAGESAKLLRLLNRTPESQSGTDLLRAYRLLDRNPKK